MNHVMLDIETMGTRPGSAIVSLAAVQFDITSGETGQEIYRQVDLQSCLDMGLKVEAKTLFWWFKQSKEAQCKISSGEHLSKVLSDFYQFINKLEAAQAVSMQLWGNSARFDLGILESCYIVNQTKLPWNTWTERDVRTMNFLLPNVRDSIGFEGTPHSPIDDCKHQIKYLCEIYKRLIK